MPTAFTVEKIQITTRATRRSMRGAGSSPSDGKGYRAAWIVVGPFDAADSYHAGIASCRYETRGAAMRAADRLNATPAA